MKLYYLIPVAFAFLARAAFAVEPTFGPEWEFGSWKLWHLQSLKNLKANGGVVPDEKHEGRAVKAFADEVRKRCGTDCVETTYRGRGDDVFDSHKFTFKDGYWFAVTPDTMTVEVKAAPQTLLELKKNRDRVQHLVFDSAKAIGLKAGGSHMPYIFPGTSHFNMGTYSAFEDDGKAYLRFLMDYFNTPELALGVLGQDRLEGPAIVQRTAEERAALQKIVDDVNGGMDLTSGEVADRINDEVYTTSSIDEIFDSVHSQSVGLKNAGRATLTKDAPTELRAINAQRSMDEFIDLAELMEARMKLAKKATAAGELIPYRNTNRFHFSKTDLANAYYTYVKEADLDYERFRKILPPSLVNQEPDAFLTGKKGWKSWGYRAGVERQIDRVASSEWLRNKMKIALSDEIAIKSGDSKKVMEKIIAKMNDVATHPSARKTYASFLSDLSEQESLKKLKPFLTTELEKSKSAPAWDFTQEKSGWRCKSHFTNILKKLVGKK